MYPLSEHRRRRRSAGAFTLTEILVTLGILSLTLAGLIPFFISNYTYLFTGEQKLLINADIRDLTNEMVETARAANFFVLYESFDPQTVAGVTVRRDSNNNGVINANDRCQAGEAGNFLVFVYYEDPYYDARLFDGDTTNNPPILTVEVNRLVLYWTAPHRSISGETALYKFDTDDYRSGTSWSTPWGITLPVTVDSATSVESLLPPSTAAWAKSNQAAILVNDVTGLASGSLGFENFQNRSVLVRLKILHGNQAKRVTNTYNFTITPRG